MKDLVVSKHLNHKHEFTAHRIYGSLHPLIKLQKKHADFLKITSSLLKDVIQIYLLDNAQHETKLKYDHRHNHFLSIVTSIKDEIQITYYFDA